MRVEDIDAINLRDASECKKGAGTRSSMYFYYGFVEYLWGVSIFHFILFKEVFSLTSPTLDPHNSVKRVVHDI